MKPSEAGEKGRKRKNQSPTPGKGPNALDFYKLISKIFLNSKNLKNEPEIKMT